MSPFASWLLVTVFVGGPTLILGCVLRLASRASREEERILVDELVRKAPTPRPTPAPRPFIRETTVLDYSTMTREDMLRAFDHEAHTPH